MTDSQLVQAYGFHGVMTAKSLVLWLDDATDQVVCAKGPLAWDVRHRTLPAPSVAGDAAHDTVIAGPFADQAEAQGEALRSLRRMAERLHAPARS